MVGLLRADDLLQVLDVFLAIGQAIVGLRGEIRMSELQILVALEQSGVLVPDSQQLRVEDASGRHLVFDQLFDLHVFAVVDALQAEDLLLAGVQLHRMVLPDAVELVLVGLNQLLAQLVELHASDLLRLDYLSPEHLAIPLKVADVVLVVNPLLV